VGGGLGCEICRLQFEKIYADGIKAIMIARIKTRSLGMPPRAFGSD
jgi:hypothetical protein